MRNILTIFLIILVGCSSFQIRQEILDMEIRDVTSAKDKNVADFKLSQKDSYQKITNIIKGMHAVIGKEERGKFFIVAHRFNFAYTLCIDTTKVGILVESTGSETSRVLVASGNTDLAKFVSSQIFKELKK